MIEMEQLMMAAGATEADISDARRNIREAIYRSYPGFQYASERQEIRGKLLVLIRRYEYSKWEAFKRRFLNLFSRSENPVQEGS